MTPRTVSLLLLSVVGFAGSALVVAGIQRFGAGTGLASPLLMPLVAALCSTCTFFAGRRYILPPRIAGMAFPAMALLIGMTLMSMLMVYLVVWATRSLGAAVPSGVVLALWFFALWSLLSALHRFVNPGISD